MGQLLCKGDIVAVHGDNVGKIETVLPKEAEKPQLYVVLLNTGGFVICPENRLTVIHPWHATCECGAHRTPGHANLHSHWCPAWTPA